MRPRATGASEIGWPALNFAAMAQIAQLPGFFGASFFSGRCEFAEQHVLEPATEMTPRVWPGIMIPVQANHRIAKMRRKPRLMTAERIPKTFTVQGHS